jgi:8-oxo-dGTP pyrophosphatase MutT (NUDIX family)
LVCAFLEFICYTLKVNKTRTHIHQIISQLKPCDEREARDRLGVLNWIESGAPLMRTRKPDIPLKHLVSYFVILDLELCRVLLVDHIKAGLWLPTGGHVEPDERPRDTVERECIEELGIPAAFTTQCADLPLFLTVTQTRGVGTHTDVSLWYVASGDSRGELAYDRSEFRAVRWFGFDELRDMDSARLDPEFMRFMSKLQRALT